MRSSRVLIAAMLSFVLANCETAPSPEPPSAPPETDPGAAPWKPTLSRSPRTRQGAAWSSPFREHVVAPEWIVAPASPPAARNTIPTPAGNIEGTPGTPVKRPPKPDSAPLLPLNIIGLANAAGALSREDAGVTAGQASGEAWTPYYSEGSIGLTFSPP